MGESVTLTRETKKELGSRARRAVRNLKPHLDNISERIKDLLGGNGPGGFGGSGPLAA